MIIMYALSPFAALGLCVSLKWIRNEFKEKPSYAPLFRGLRGPLNGH